MKLKNFAAGVVMAAASFGAFAGDQTVSVIADGNAHTFTALAGDGVLSGGLDVLTFGSNLAAGTYNVAISLTGQNLTFSNASTLNGVNAQTASLFGLEFLGVKVTGGSPFTLDLVGTAAAGANYAGTYTITAVPEPETYGMLLGGLALVGFVARRKAKKAA